MASSHISMPFQRTLYVANHLTLDRLNFFFAGCSLLLCDNRPSVIYGHLSIKPKVCAKAPNLTFDSEKALQNSGMVLQYLLTDPVYQAALKTSRPYEPISCLILCSMVDCGSLDGHRAVGVSQANLRPLRSSNNRSRTVAEDSQNRKPIKLSEATGKSAGGKMIMDAEIVDNGEDESALNHDQMLAEVNLGREKRMKRMKEAISDGRWVLNRNSREYDPSGPSSGNYPSPYKKEMIYTKDELRKMSLMNVGKSTDEFIISWLKELKPRRGRFY